MKRNTRPNARLLTLKAAEAEYGLPYSTLWQLVTEGSLARVNLPHNIAIYIRRVDLDSFIERHTTEVR